MHSALKIGFITLISSFGLTASAGTHQCFDMHPNHSHTQWKGAATYTPSHIMPVNRQNMPYVAANHKRIAVNTSNVSAMNENGVTVYRPKSNINLAALRARNAVRNQQNIQRAALENQRAQMNVQAQALATQNARLEARLARIEGQQDILIRQGQQDKPRRYSRARGRYLYTGYSNSYGRDRYPYRRNRRHTGRRHP